MVLHLKFSVGRDVPGKKKRKGEGKRDCPLAILDAERGGWKEKKKKKGEKESRPSPFSTRGKRVITSPWPGKRERGEEWAERL